MASSVGSTFARKLQRAAVEAQRAARPALGKAGMAMKPVVASSILTGAPSGRLRGVGRKGAKVGVRYELLTKGGRNGVMIRATGPLHLLERDNKPHAITVKMKGRGNNRRQRAGALKLPSGFRRTVQHPGSKGKHVFARGVERAIPVGTLAVRSAMVDAVRRGIRG